PARAPPSAASKIARVIESQYGRFLERRCEKCGRGVRLVMLHHDDFAVRKLIAESNVEERFRSARERPCDRDAVHLITRRTRQSKALRDGRVRHPAGPQASCELRFFDGGFQFAVFEHSARRVSTE